MDVDTNSQPSIHNDQQSSAADGVAGANDTSANSLGLVIAEETTDEIGNTDESQTTRSDVDKVEELHRILHEQPVEHFAKHFVECFPTLQKILSNFNNGESKYENGKSLCLAILEAYARVEFPNDKFRRELIELCISHMLTGSRWEERCLRTLKFLKIEPKYYTDVKHLQVACELLQKCMTCALELEDGEITKLAAIIQLVEPLVTGSSYFLKNARDALLPMKEWLNKRQKSKYLELQMYLLRASATVLRECIVTSNNFPNQEAFAQDIFRGTSALLTSNISYNQRAFLMSILTRLVQCNNGKCQGLVSQVADTDVLELLNRDYTGDSTVLAWILTTTIQCVGSIESSCLSLSSVEHCLNLITNSWKAENYHVRERCFTLVSILIGHLCANYKRLECNATEKVFKVVKAFFYIATNELRGMLLVSRKWRDDVFTTYLRSSIPVLVDIVANCFGVIQHVYIRETRVEAIETSACFCYLVRIASIINAVGSMQSKKRAFGTFLDASDTDAILASAANLLTHTFKPSSVLYSQCTALVLPVTLAMAIQDARVLQLYECFNLEAATAFAPRLLTLLMHILERDDPNAFLLSIVSYCEGTLGLYVHAWDPCVDYIANVDVHKMYQTCFLALNKVLHLFTLHAECIVACKHVIGSLLQILSNVSLQDGNHRLLAVATRVFENLHKARIAGVTMDYWTPVLTRIYRKIIDQWNEADPCWREFLFIAACCGPFDDDFITKCSTPLLHVIKDDNNDADVGGHVLQAALALLESWTDNVLPSNLFKILSKNTVYYKEPNRDIAKAAAAAPHFIQCLASFLQSNSSHPNSRYRSLLASRIMSKLGSFALNFTRPLSVKGSPTAYRLGIVVVDTDGGSAITAGISILELCNSIEVNLRRGMNLCDYKGSCEFITCALGSVIDFDSSATDFWLALATRGEGHAYPRYKRYRDIYFIKALMRIFCKCISLAHDSPMFAECSELKRLLLLRQGLINYVVGIYATRYKKHDVESGISPCILIRSIVSNCRLDLDVDVCIDILAQLVETSLRYHIQLLPDAIYHNVCLACHSKDPNKKAGACIAAIKLCKVDATFALQHTSQLASAALNLCDGDRRDVMFEMFDLLIASNADEVLQWSLSLFDHPMYQVRMAAEYCLVNLGRTKLMAEQIQRQCQILEAQYPDILMCIAAIPNQNPAMLEMAMAQTIPLLNSLLCITNLTEEQRNQADYSFAIITELHSNPDYIEVLSSSDKRHLQGIYVALVKLLVTGCDQVSRRADSVLSNLDLDSNIVTQGLEPFALQLQHSLDSGMLDRLLSVVSRFIHQVEEPILRALFNVARLYIETSLKNGIADEYRNVSFLNILKFLAQRGYGDACADLIFESWFQYVDDMGNDVGVDVTFPLSLMSPCVAYTLWDVLQTCMDNHELKNRLLRFRNIELCHFEPVSLPYLIETNVQASVKLLNFAAWSLKRIKAEIPEFVALDKMFGRFCVQPSIDLHTYVEFPLAWDLKEIDRAHMARTYFSILTQHPQLVDVESLKEFKGSLYNNCRSVSTDKPVKSLLNDCFYECLQKSAIENLPSDPLHMSTLAHVYSSKTFTLKQILALLLKDNFPDILQGHSSSSLLRSLVEYLWESTSVEKGNALDKLLGVVCLAKLVKWNNTPALGGLKVLKRFVQVLTLESTVHFLNQRQLATLEFLYPHSRYDLYYLLLSSVTDLLLSLSRAFVPEKLGSCPVWIHMVKDIASQNVACAIALIGATARHCGNYINELLPVFRQVLDEINAQVLDTDCGSYRNYYQGGYLDAFFSIVLLFEENSIEYDEKWACSLCVRLMLNAAAYDHVGISLVKRYEDAALALFCKCPPFVYIDHTLRQMQQLRLVEKYCFDHINSSGIGYSASLGSDFDTANTTSVKGKCTLNRANALRAFPVLNTSKTIESRKREQYFNSAAMLALEIVDVCLETFDLEQLQHVTCVYTHIWNIKSPIVSKAFQNCLSKYTALCTQVYDAANGFESCGILQWLRQHVVTQVKILGECKQRPNEFLAPDLDDAINGDVDIEVAQEETSTDPLDAGIRNRADNVTTTGPDCNGISTQIPNNFVYQETNKSDGGAFTDAIKTVQEDLAFPIEPSRAEKVAAASVFGDCIRALLTIAKTIEDAKQLTRFLQENVPLYSNALLTVLNYNASIQFKREAIHMGKLWMQNSLWPLNAKHHIYEEETTPTSPSTTTSATTASAPQGVFSNLHYLVDGDKMFVDADAGKRLRQLLMLLYCSYPLLDPDGEAMVQQVLTLLTSGPCRSLGYGDTVLDHLDRIFGNLGEACSRQIKQSTVLHDGTLDSIAVFNLEDGTFAKFGPCTDSLTLISEHVNASPRVEIDYSELDANNEFPSELLQKGESNDSATQEAATMATSASATAKTIDNHAPISGRKRRRRVSTNRRWNFAGLIKRLQSYASSESSKLPLYFSIGDLIHVADANTCARYSNIYCGLVRQQLKHSATDLASLESNEKVSLTKYLALACKLEALQECDDVISFNSWMLQDKPKTIYDALLAMTRCDLDHCLPRANFSTMLDILYSMLDPNIEYFASIDYPKLASLAPRQTPEHFQLDIIPLDIGNEPEERRRLLQMLKNFRSMQSSESIASNASDAAGAGESKASTGTAGRDNGNVNNKKADLYNKLITDINAFNVQYLSSNLGSGKLMGGLFKLWHNHVDVAATIWLSIFPQLYAVLSEYEKEHIAQELCQMLARSKNADALISGTVLQAAMSCEDPIFFPPELLKYVATTTGAWYECILNLEHQILSQPLEITKVATVLSSLFQKLNLMDLLIGTNRTWVITQESRLALAFMQHSKWKQAQREFNMIMENLSNSGHTAEAVATFDEGRMWYNGWVLATKQLGEWDIARDVASAAGDNRLYMQASTALQEWPTTEAVDENYICKLDSAEYKLHCIYQKFNLGFSPLKNGQTKINAWQCFQKAKTVEPLLVHGKGLVLDSWKSLPYGLSEAHSVPIHLHQRYIEVDEGLKCVKNVLAALDNGSVPREQMLATRWRRRLARSSESPSVWQEILSWRCNVYSIIKTIVDANTSIPKDLRAAVLHENQDLAWSLVKFASICRKSHQLPLMASGLLNKAQNFISTIIAKHQITEDTYICLIERMKQYLSLPLNLPDALKSVVCFDIEGLPSKNLETLKSHLIRLKADALHRKNSLEISKRGGLTMDLEFTCKYMLEALKLEPLLCKNWISWAKFNDRKIDRGAVNRWIKNDTVFPLVTFENAITGYLVAISLRPTTHWLLIGRTLTLLKEMHNAGLTVASEAFKKYSVRVPCSIWLAWLPQLINALLGSISAEAYHILHFLMSKNTQQVFYSIRSEYLHLQQSPRAGVVFAAPSPSSGLYGTGHLDAEMLKRIYSDLIAANPSYGSVLESFATCLTLIGKPNFVNEVQCAVETIFEECLDLPFKEMVPEPIMHCLTVKIPQRSAFSDAGEFEPLMQHFKEDFKVGATMTCGECMNKLLDWLVRIYRLNESSRAYGIFQDVDLMRVHSFCQRVQTTNLMLQFPTVLEQVMADIYDFSKENKCLVQQRLVSFVSPHVTCRKRGNHLTRCISIYDQNGHHYIYSLHPLLLPKQKTEQHLNQIIRLLNVYAQKYHETRRRNLSLPVSNIVPLDPFVCLFEDGLCEETMSETLLHQMPNVNLISTAVANCQTNYKANGNGEAVASTLPVRMPESARGEVVLILLVMHKILMESGVTNELIKCWCKYNASVECEMTFTQVYQLFKTKQYPWFHTWYKKIHQDVLQRAYNSLCSIVPDDLLFAHVRSLYSNYQDLFTFRKRLACSYGGVAILNLIFATPYAVPCKLAIDYKAGTARQYDILRLSNTKEMLIEYSKLRVFRFTRNLNTMVGTVCRMGVLPAVMYSLASCIHTFKLDIHGALVDILGDEFPEVTIPQVQTLQMQQPHQQVHMQQQQQQNMYGHVQHHQQAMSHHMHAMHQMQTQQPPPTQQQQAPGQYHHMPQGHANPTSQGPPSAAASDGKVEGNTVEDYVNRVLCYCTYLRSNGTDTAPADHPNPPINNVVTCVIDASAESTTLGKLKTCYQPWF